MAKKEWGSGKAGGEKRTEPKRDERTKGSMTVQEAGHKGGQRERELVKEGHRQEGNKNRK